MKLFNGANQGMHHSGSLPNDTNINNNNSNISNNQNQQEHHELSVHLLKIT